MVLPVCVCVCDCSVSVPPPSSAGPTCCCWFPCRPSPETMCADSCRPSNQTPVYLQRLTAGDLLRNEQPHPDSPGRYCQINTSVRFHACHRVFGMLLVMYCHVRSLNRNPVQAGGDSFTDSLPMITSTLLFRPCSRSPVRLWKLSQVKYKSLLDSL